MILGLIALPGSDSFGDFPGSNGALLAQRFERGQRLVEADGHSFDVTKAVKSERGWNLTGTFTGARP